ncbi:hypothetical protein LUZ60_004258 [Juncus effusus]|nr:hypothetical protein LUZ60_004258 [Juncus effusus]
MEESSDMQITVAESSEQQTQTESWVPKLDMIFESEDKAYWFYCNYAKELGFGVRKHFVKRRSSGQVYCRVFSCYKEGFSRNPKEGKKPRADTRTGCKAHFTIRINEQGQFRVTEFDPVHNHDLIPKPVPNPDLNTNLPVPKTLKNPKTLKPVQQIKKFVPLKCTGTGTSTSTSTSTASGMSSESSVPKMDMEFEDADVAYLFYVNYADSIGFSVRKHYVKKRASGLVYSRTFVCHKEGFKRKRGDEKGERKPKPYDRTGCPALLTVHITKNGKFRVTEFESKHNHPLVIPSKAHLVKWRWRKKYPSHLQNLLEEEEEEELGFENEGENENEDMDISTLVPVNCINYTRSKRKEGCMRDGELGEIMKYFQEKQIMDPGFYYSLQLDPFDRVTNVFWNDSKSKFDFEIFGDLICFDTTYRYSENVRPLVLFLGLNNHKQIILFGSAFLYNESEESFKWLFESFKNSMRGKKPKVVLTDRHVAIPDWLSEIWEGIERRFCAWQVYNEALSYLNSVFVGSNTFDKEFSRVLYDFEELEEFEFEWDKMVKEYDLSSNDWLNDLYKEREKWAPPYNREIFCGDIRNSLRKENFSSLVRKYSNQELEFREFIRDFEIKLEVIRENELRADVRIDNQVQLFPFARILKQGFDFYTLEIFRVFQAEFEFSLDFMIYPTSQTDMIYEYRVKNGENPKEYFIKFDATNTLINCTCKKFEFVGIPCRHVIKTLDIINIKELPEKYLLNRWSKNAKRISSVRFDETSAFNADPNGSDFARRYGHLCGLLSKVAIRGAESEESYNLIESLSDRVFNQICHVLIRSRNAS